MSEINIIIDGKTYTPEEARRVYYELRKVFAPPGNIFEYYPPVQVKDNSFWPNKYEVTCTGGSWV